MILFFLPQTWWIRFLGACLKILISDILLSDAEEVAWANVLLAAPLALVLKRFQSSFQDFFPTKNVRSRKVTSIQMPYSPWSNRHHDCISNVWRNEVNSGPPNYCEISHQRPLQQLRKACFLVFLMFSFHYPRSFGHQSTVCQGSTYRERQN